MADRSGNSRLNKSKRLAIVATIGLWILVTGFEIDSAKWRAAGALARLPASCGYTMPYVAPDAECIAPVEEAADIRQGLYWKSPLRAALYVGLAWLVGLIIVGIFRWVAAGSE